MAGRLSWRKSGKRCAAAKAAGFVGRRKLWKLSHRPAFEAGADKAAGPTPMAGYLRDSYYFMRYELYEAVTQEELRGCHFHLIGAKWERRRERIVESATRGLYNPSYIRKLDKSQIPTCPIMGVEVAAINMDWLLNFTVENIKALSGDYMCVSNVHTTVTAYEDEQYRRVQNGGIMAIPDGGPLSSVGQKRGYKTMSRTTGPSYMEEIFKVSAEKGYRHYFYGSTEETLTLLKEKLEQAYPGIGSPVCIVPLFEP